MASAWDDKVREYRAAGFTWDQIAEERSRLEQEYREGGVEEAAIGEYFTGGAPTGDKDEDARGYVNERLAPPVEGEAKPAAPQRLAKTLFDYAEVGFDKSALGVIGSRPDVVPTQSANTLDRLAIGLGQFAGDLPFAIVGGALGGAGGAAAGSQASPAGGVVGGIVGAGATSAALPEVIRSSYLNYYEKGGVTSPRDFLDRVVTVAVDTAKAAAVGAVTAGAGQKAKVAAGALGAGAASRTAAQLTAEGAAGLAASSAVEGRLPTKQDVIDSAVSTLLIHAGTETAIRTVPILKTAEQNLMAQWEKTGESMSSIVRAAGRDAVLREGLLLRDPTSRSRDAVTLRDANGDELTVVKRAKSGAKPDRMAGKVTSYDPTGTVAPEDVVLNNVQYRPDQKFDVANTLDELYTGLVDELHPYKKMLAAIAGEDAELQLKAEDARVLIQDTYYSASAAEQVIKKGFSQRGVKGMDDIVPTDAARLKEFRALVTAKHALELHEKGIVNPIDRTAAEQVVAKYSKDADLNQRAADLTALNNAILDEAVDAGITAADKAAGWKAEYKNYVPFQRAILGLEQNIVGPGGSRTVFNPKKEQKGSELDILDPLENTIVGAYGVFAAASRNRAMRALVEFSQSSPEAAEVASAFFNDVTNKRVPVKLEEGGPDVFVTVRKDLGKNDALYFADGEARVLEFTPDVAKSLQGLERSDADFLVKVLEAPNKILRAGITLSPDFPLVQFFRDNPFQFIVDKGSKVPFTEFATGVAHMFTNSPEYRTWLEKGGPINIVADINKSYGDSRADFMRQYGTGPESRWHTVRNVVTTPLRLLRLWSGFISNAPRVGTFVRELKAGTADITALQRSREAQIDFRRTGNVGRQINRVVPFFNPSVQALDVLARAAIDNPSQVFTRAAAMITLPVLASWAAYNEEEWYQELPQWQKDNAVPIRIGDTTFLVPLPPGLGPLFGGLPRRLLEGFHNENPAAARGIVESLLVGFTPATTVAAIQPIIEQVTNYSFFRKRPLVPDSVKGALPEDQYTPYTSETAIKLSAYLSDLPVLQDAKLSPVALENYVSAWTGTLGRYALDAADAALRQAKGTPPGASPTADDIPFLTRFVSNYSLRNSQSVETYYENARKHEAVLKSLSLAAKRLPLDPEQAQRIQKLMSENRQEIFGLVKVSDAIAAHRKMIQLVQANPDMTPEDKRRMVDNLEHATIAMAKTANMTYAKLGKQLEAAE